MAVARRQQEQERHDLAMKRHGLAIAPPIVCTEEWGVMVFEQRYAWGRADRRGRPVCARVVVTIVADVRLGRSDRPAPRRVEARFLEGLDPALRDELDRRVRCRGASGQRLAERLQPIELVVADRHRGEQRVAGYLEPPVRRSGPLEEIDFRLRPADPEDP